jgi:hypothetical protein
MARGVPLVILLGAGASAASGNYDPNRLAPPLTVDLFDEDRYAELLHEYDLAHQAGLFIAAERAENDSLALEQILFELRNSEHEHHRKMAAAVPLYLQHLLFRVSEANRSKTVRYDRLIERALRLPYVYFVTLNYDVLLDRRLSGFHRLASMEDYIEADKNWALIKLHGSVNWFYPQHDLFPVLRPPVDINSDNQTIECVPPDAGFEVLRGGGSRATDRYPALAIPEGPKDRIVLPSRHAWFLRSGLESAQRADLLVIGYSGLDGEALSLLKEANVQIRRMTVVDFDQRSANRVLARFKDAGLEAIWPEPFDGSFEGWVDDGHLSRLVADFDPEVPQP